MRKLIKSTTLIVCGAILASCTTTYDQYGNPQQSVDPGAATAGVIGAGILGAAIANNNRRDRVHHVHHVRPRPRPYHRRPRYRRR